MAVSGVISLSIQPRFTSVQVNLKRNEILFISSRLIGDTFLYQADIVILCVYLILQLWRTSSETRPLQISVLNCVLLFVETGALTLKRRERPSRSQRFRAPLSQDPALPLAHAPWPAVGMPCRGTWATGNYFTQMPSHRAAEALDQSRPGRDVFQCTFPAFWGAVVLVARRSVPRSDFRVYSWW